MKFLLYNVCLIGLATVASCLLFPNFRDVSPVVEVPNISEKDVDDAFKYAEDQMKQRIDEENKYLHAGGSLSPTALRAEVRLFGIVPDKAMEMHRIQVQLEDATKYLAKWCNLTYPQMLGLANITLPKDQPLLQKCREHNLVKACDPNAKYRTMDGSCNNLKNPTWGATFRAAGKMAWPDYGDGISAIRASKGGYSLPNAKVIADAISPDVDVPSKNLTHLAMTFGQWLVHDSSSILMARAGTKNQQTKCCPPKGNTLPIPSFCIPVEIPKYDVMYKMNNQDCMPFGRSMASSTECTLGTPRHQLEMQNGFYDLSQLYGMSDEDEKMTRTFKGGRLVSIQTVHGGELPMESPQPELDQCSVTLKKNRKCFWSADLRSTSQPGILGVHTLTWRQHNRVAGILSSEYPEKTDEEIYQEARRIVIARTVMAAYKEYLPVILGPELMNFFKLDVLDSGYTEYDPSIDATMTVDFATGANRFGHSQIQNQFKKVDSNGKTTGSIETATNQFQRYPDQFYDGEMDSIMRGQFYQESQETDRFYVDGMASHSTQGPDEKFGLDIRVLEIMRGRDHGLPSYTAMVDYCFGVTIHSFEDLELTMSGSNIQRVKRVYRDVEDIDFVIGGLLETAVAGGTVGPTFACILGKGFHNQKYGDRFYFEHGNQVGSFTEGQLAEIRNSTLASFMCEVSDDMKMITPHVLQLKDGISNSMVKCEDLPTTNLTKWFDK